MKDQSLDKYVILHSRSKVEKEIFEEAYFDSVKKAEEWIRTEDPGDQYAWDIYRVQISLEKSL